MNPKNSAPGETNPNTTKPTVSINEIITIIDDNGKLRIRSTLYYWIRNALPVALPSLILGGISKFGNDAWHKLTLDSIEEKYTTNTSLLILSYAILAIVAVTPVTALLNMAFNARKSATYLAKWVIFKPLSWATNLIITTTTAAILFELARSTITWKFFFATLTMIFYISLIYGFVMISAYFSCIRAWMPRGVQKIRDNIIFWTTYTAIAFVTISDFTCRYFAHGACSTCQLLQAYYANLEGFSIITLGILISGLAIIQWISKK
ncbi:MAG: hypothetical protein LBJ65_15405 [Burkholderia sp.]|jgi:hypothetical protein|uniref:hypothetical protein n=1 Tax=Burkholderia sp. TaxID=36773 RepID=UPI00281D90F1|nr:hypothetical protein [Burkholderia sp.]MDR0242981.1 hypothetical protein [Burkholderia sp.]